MKARKCKNKPIWSSAPYRKGELNHNKTFKSILIYEIPISIPIYENVNICNLQYIQGSCRFQLGKLKTFLDFFKSLTFKIKDLYFHTKLLTAQKDCRF